LYNSTLPNFLICSVVKASVQISFEESVSSCHTQM
jgi:hypothetical protein